MIFETKIGVLSPLQVACFGSTVYSAFLKALMSTGFKLPPPEGNILIGVQESFQPKFLATAKKFHDLGFNVRTPSLVVFITV